MIIFLTVVAAAFTAPKTLSVLGDKMLELACE